MIATGVYWNGKKAYLRNNWNKLDFLIILFSISSFAPLSIIDFSAMNVLRLMRFLRPLRILSKS